MSFFHLLLSAGQGIPYPNVQANNILVTGITSTSLSFSWTNGNGESRIMLIRESSLVSNSPSDNTTYTANSIFGSGSQVGIGNYVVFNGVGNTVTITGLTPNTDYFVRVFEYNGSSGSERYFVNSATNNPISELTFTTQFQLKLDEADILGVSKPTLTGIGGQIEYNGRIRDLIIADKWDVNDKIYLIPNNAGIRFAEIELKNPSGPRLTEVANGGALIFDPIQGVKSDGLAYWDAGFALSSLSGYQADDCFIGAVFYEPLANAQSMGSRGASSIRAVITPRDASDRFVTIINSGTALQTTYVLEPEFNYLSVKRDAGTQTNTANETITSQAIASTSVPTQTYFVLGQNNNGVILAGSQIQSPLAFLCIGPKEGDGTLEIVRDFFTEPPPPPVGEFQFGNLEQIHPDETFDQILQRRSDNLTVFKQYCDAYKVTGEVLNIPNGERLEMYIEPTITVDLTDGTINILEDETLTINNEGEIVFYPFTLDMKRFTVFNVKYGGTLNLNGDWTGQDIQGKFETYNITFQKDGNPKLLQINSTVRSGFWEGLSNGDIFFVNFAHETQGAEVTIDSIDALAGTITTVEDLPGSPNLNNQYTTGGFIFPRTISFTDYQQYGQFWIYDLHRCYFVYSIPPNQSSPPIVTINLTNFSIYGFARQISVSLANGLIKYFGTSCTHERSEISVNFFSRGTANYQRYDFTEVDNLYFIDCGTLAGGSISAITAGDILGSGAYIHPNIIVRGGSATDPNDLTVGILRLHNNIGTSFRQYSFGGDNPVILGDPEYRSEFGLIDCIDNIEADVRTSNLIPTRITELRNASANVNLHYETTINGGNIIGPAYANPNESNDQGLFETNIVLNNMTIYCPLAFDVSGNIQLNNCDILIEVADVNSKTTFNIISDLPNVEIIDCTLIPNASISRYTPGGAEPPSAVFGKSLIFAGNIPEESETLNLGYIENTNILDNDFYCGYIIQEDDGFASYENRNRKFVIKDSDLRISRFSDYTQLRENFTNQVEVDNSRINSPRMVQSTSERPFKYSPRTTSVSKTISDGIIEFDFENEINITGGGTLHTLFPILYNGASKINCSMWYDGTIRLNAVGTSFTISNAGNIDQNVVVNAGNFIELTGSRDIIGILTPTSIVLATSDGTLTQIKNTLAALVGIDRRYVEVTNITSDEVATVDANGDIVGVNTYGIFDNRTGSFDILFNTPVPNGQTVTLNYQYYSTISYKGVWKG